MNLFSIARGVVATINPEQWATIAIASGNTTDPDGTRRPTYLPPRRVRAQVQDLSSKDLRLMDGGLNLQGSSKTIYLAGRWTGIVRQDKRGGDLIELQDGSIWLVTMVAEDWGDKRGWVKVLSLIHI